MITVEWHNEQKCDNCGQNKPHCAELTLPIEALRSKISGEIETGLMLCSDCVEDLKKRLS